MEKNILRMSMTERFKYLNGLKRIKFNSKREANDGKESFKRER